MLENHVKPLLLISYHFLGGGEEDHFERFVLDLFVSISFKQPSLMVPVCEFGGNKKDMLGSKVFQSIVGEMKKIVKT